MQIESGSWDAGTISMHDTALAIGRMFFGLYGDQPGLRVVELGSQDVNGSFREVLPQGCSYIGLDLEPGKNVDLVCRGTHIALPDGAADLTLASSIFEHDPLFRMTFLELCRITAPGGFIYLNAPSNGMVHRFPEDCWRFYPDAALALVAWARSQGFQITCVESFTAERRGDMWNDFVAIFARGNAVAPREDVRFLHAHVPCANVRRFDREETLSPATATEDMRLLAAAVQALATLEARAAQVMASAPNGVSAGDGRPSGYVGGMMAAIQASGGTDVPRVAAGQLGPFENSFRTIYRALSAMEEAPSLPQREPEQPAENPAPVQSPAVESDVTDRVSALEGRVDKVDSTEVSGWIWDGFHPERRLSVNIEFEGQVVATATADHYRPDLEAAGIDDGRHAFMVRLPELSGFEPQKISCVVPSISFRIPIGKKAYDLSSA
jgi:hypothetical protein